jgi:deoxyribodipyrimidine photo-lyase
METTVDDRRIRCLKEGTPGGPVIYWMSRDQRVVGNWALLYAREMAERLGSPLAVLFCLVPRFLDATMRQYDFMLRGLADIEKRLAHLRIPFFLHAGEPPERVPGFIKEQKAGCLVTDFDPVRIKREWKDGAIARVGVPVYEVDAHNIVPCWVASPKREFGAYTIRPKIRRLLTEFLVPYPAIKPPPEPWKTDVPAVDWRGVREALDVDSGVAPVAWTKPGETAAREALARFVGSGLHAYADARNDPMKEAQSHLSPYLHFGHISSQEAALAVAAAKAPGTAKDAFLEELIVRKELSDNFCFYTADYDRTSCFPDWAKKTLEAHRSDRRGYVYSVGELEEGRTHDELWNAAQLEMARQGKMHGYLRMYWAKKILEWTSAPEEAMETAIYLNDRYELDGRDPNGYAGIAWSIGGVHDRAWGERPIFGKIRYMSYGGAKSKFDIKAYVCHVEALE